MTTKPEWTKFAVGAPSTRSNWSNADCVPFELISHVTHLHSALSIVKDGQIRAGLVFDESKLNSERILVSWCSPNHWHKGFRYGGIRFDFPFDALVKDLKPYWVESIAYKVAACRILFSREDHSSRLPAYPLHDGTGPLWLDRKSGKYYHQSQHCLEVMIEDAIPLALATSIGFVKHHANFCNIDPGSCKELGAADDWYAARFFAALLGEDIPLAATLYECARKPSPTVRQFSDGFFSDLKPNLAVTGQIEAADARAPALARAVFSRFALGSRSDAESLCALFASKTDLFQALGELIERRFEWRPKPDGTWVE